MNTQYSWDFTSSAVSHGITAKMAINRQAVIPTPQGIVLGVASCAYLNLSPLDPLRNHFVLRLVVKDIQSIDRRTVYCGIGIKDQRTMNSSVYVYRNGGETFPRLGFGSATLTKESVANESINMLDSNEHVLDIVVSYGSHESRNVELFVDNVRADDMVGATVTTLAITTPMVFLGSTGYLQGSSSFIDNSDLIVRSLTLFLKPNRRLIPRLISGYGAHAWYRLRLRPKEMPNAVDNYIAMSELSLDSVLSYDGSDNLVEVTSSTLSLLTSTEYGEVPTFTKDLGGIYRSSNKVYKEVVQYLYPKCKTLNDNKQSHMVDILYRFGTPREVCQVRLANASRLENQGGKGLVEYFELYHSDDSVNWHHIDSVRVNTSLWSDAEYRCLVWQLDPSNNGTLKYKHIVNTNPQGEVIPFGTRSVFVGYFTSGSYGAYVPPTSEFPNSENYSVSMWIRPTSYDGTLWSFGSHKFQLDPLGYLKVSGGSSSVLGVSPIPSNTWTHVAFTWDSFQRVTLYVNGEVDSSGVLTRTFFSANDSMRIGNQSGGYGGYIDDIAWYDTTLSESQVYDIYNDGTPGDLSLLGSSDHLYAWWTFEGQSGTDAGPWGRHMSTTGVLFTERTPFINYKSAIFAGDSTSNQYAELTTWAPNTGADVSGVSVSAWIQPQTNSTENWVYVLGDRNYPSAGAGAHLSLSVGASNGTLTSSWGTTNSELTYTPSSVYDGWHHVACTYERNQRDNARSLSLDGSTQYGSVHVTKWFKLRDYSVSAWIKRSSANRRDTIYHPFMSTSNDSAWRHLFMVDANNKLTIFHNFGTLRTIESLDTLVAGVWYHVAFTWDSSDNVKLYINGSLNGNGTITSNPSLPEPVYLYVGRGWNPASPGECFSGNLDHFSMWNTALDASTMASLYNQGIPPDLRYHSLSDRLMVYYPFELMNGTNAVEPVRYSIQFNGTTQWGTVDMTSWMLYNNYSVSAWIKVSSVTKRHMIYHPYVATNVKYNHFFAVDSNSKLLIHQESSTPDFLNSTSSITENTWTHVAFTWTAGNLCTVYINGSANGSITWTANPTYAAGSLIELDIGRSWNRAANATDNFSGLMDEYSIWNTALTAAQVSEIWNQGVPGDLANHSKYTNLMAWWRFDTMDGTDLSANERSLVLYDTPSFSSDVPGRRDLTFTGSPTFSTDAPGPMSLELNGTNQYGINSSVVFTSGAWSLSFWAKGKNLPPNQSLWMLFDTRTSGESGNYCLTVSQQNSSGAVLSIGAEGASYYTSTVFNDLSWHHYVVTTDASKTYIYEDGIFKSTLNFAAIARNFYVGARFLLDTWSYYNGKLDDIALWSSSLTAEHVTEIYNNGKPKDLQSHSQAGNLQVYWKFDTMDGTNTVASNVTKSLVLNGINQYGTNTSLTFTSGAWSVAFWVRASKLPTGGNDFVIDGRSDPITNCFYAFHEYGTGGNHLFKIGGDSAPNWETTRLNDLNWHHYVFTTNGTSSYVYEDGVYKTTLAFGALIRKITIGSRNNQAGDGGYFAGEVDELSLWNSLLDPSSVQAIYNNGIPRDLSVNFGSYTFSGNLRAYWTFESSNGNDSSSYFHNLTLSGGPTFSKNTPESKFLNLAGSPTFSTDIPESCIGKIYYDGSLVATKTGNPLSPTIRPHVSIGRGYQSGAFQNAWFKGYLDEIGIFQTVLSPAEVTEIYNQGTPKELINHSRSSWLECYWKFQEFSQGRLRDESGNERHLLVNYSGAKVPQLSDFTPSIKIETKSSYLPSVWSSTVLSDATPDGALVIVLEYQTGTTMRMRCFDTSTFQQSWFYSYTMTATPTKLACRCVTNSTLVVAYNSGTNVYIDRFGISYGSCSRDNQSSTSFAVGGTSIGIGLARLDLTGKYIVCTVRGSYPGVHVASRYYANGTLYDNLTWNNVNWGGSDSNVCVPYIGSGSGFDFIGGISNNATTDASHPLYVYVTNTSTATYGNVDLSKDPYQCVAGGRLSDGNVVLVIHDSASSRNWYQALIIHGTTGVALQYFMSDFTSSLSTPYVQNNFYIPFLKGALYLGDIINTSKTLGSESTLLRYVFFTEAFTKTLTTSVKTPWNVDTNHGNGVTIHALQQDIKYLMVIPRTINNTQTTAPFVFPRTPVLNTVSSKLTHGVIPWKPTTQAVTFSCWLYLIDPNVSNIMSIVQFTDGTATRMQIETSRNDNLITIYNRDSSSGNGYAIYSLPDGNNWWGRWHHLVAIWTNEAKVPVMYIDGAIPSLWSSSARPSTQNLYPYDYVQMFVYPNKTGAPCNGFFADIAFYDIALSSTQVSAMYNNGNPPDPLVLDSSQNLQVYIKGDSIVQSNQLYDSTGKGRNMTLSVSDSNYSALIAANPHSYQFVEINAPKSAESKFDLTGAVAAYGLRKISASYSGPAVRVRRSNDNTECDVYLDPSRNVTKIHTNSLLASLTYTYSASSYPTHQGLRCSVWGPTNNVSFYVSMWIKPALFNFGDPEYALFSAGNGNNLAIISKDASHGNLFQGYFRDNSANSYGYSAFKLSPGDAWWDQWHHFVVHMNVATGTAPTAYCDGNLLMDASGIPTNYNTHRTTSTNASSTSGTFTVACQQYGGQTNSAFQYMRGKVMEVGVFQGDCDASKVLELWNSGSPQDLLQNSNVVNLMAYWKMTEGLTGTNTFRNWSPNYSQNALTLFSNDSVFSSMVSSNDFLPTLQVVNGPASFSNWCGTGLTYSLVCWYDQIGTKHLMTPFSSYPTTNATLSAATFNNSTTALYVSGGVLPAGSSTYAFAALFKTASKTGHAVIMEQSSPAWTTSMRGSLIVYDNNALGFSGLFSNDVTITPTTVSTGVLQRAILAVENANVKNIELTWNGNTYKTGTASPRTMNLASDRFTVGCNNNGAGLERFNGTMYELIVFNTSPSQFQIHQIDRLWSSPLYRV